MKKNEANKLKVFISNSEHRSKMIAQKLRKWLPLIIDNVEPWVAAQDINPGKQWFLELQKQMSEEKNIFCLLIVTPENKLKHWIHFEMGVMLNVATDGCVVPVLFDLTQNQLDDPIRQYQTVSMNKDGMLALLHQLNAASGNSVPDHQLEKSFKDKWPDLEYTIKSELTKEGRESGFRSETGLGLAVRRRESELKEGNFYFQKAESAKILAMTYETLGETISTLKFRNLTSLSMHVYALRNLFIDHPKLYRLEDGLKFEWREGVTKTIRGFLSKRRCPHLADFDVVVMSVAPSLTGTNICWRDREERGDYLRMTFTINGCPPADTQTISVSRTDEIQSDDYVFDTFKKLFDSVGRVSPPPLMFPVVRNGHRRPITKKFIDLLMNVCNHPKVGVKDRDFHISIQASQLEGVITPKRAGTALCEWLEKHPKRSDVRVVWNKGENIVKIQDDHHSNPSNVLAGSTHRYACFLLLTHKSSVLMISHLKEPWVFDLPGGKVTEADTCDHDTLVREVFEELSFELDISREMPSLGFVYDPKSSLENMPVIAQYFHYRLEESEYNLLNNMICTSTKGHEIKWLSITSILKDKRNAGNKIEALCHAPTHVFEKLAKEIRRSTRGRPCS